MALIFDIKRYAIHDGPGIRTTIFVKGCPLRCVWCHNPESWISTPQRLYKQNKCIGCATCVEECEQGVLTLTKDGVRSTDAVCVKCGKCADACPALALEICGREWSREQLLDEIEKERGVMSHGGGVTISGGEPLMHPEFTISLLKELGARGFHRAVDTTLFASSEIVKEVAKECELFLVDIKSMDPEAHKRYTGVSNETIIKNIRLISSLNHPYYIRIPLIKEINASEDNIDATVEFLSSLERQPEAIDLLPYHDIGKGKHQRIGSVYNPEDIELTSPSEEEIERCVNQFKKKGLNVTVAK